MTFPQIVLILICVMALAIGQLLFKISARNLGSDDRATALLSLPGDPWFVLSLFLYVFATLLWVWLLRKVPLVAAYPFIALSFVLVPLLSGVFLGEQVNLTYWIGICLIVSGIVVTMI